MTTRWIWFVPSYNWVVSQVLPARTPPSRESLRVTGFLPARPSGAGSYRRVVGMKVGMISVLGVEVGELVGELGAAG
ncbi:MAG: hypothetical protein AVDCRST_MAG60-1353 [uncultured Nocardioides sp.]|uniref:Uncharacterized protein n=1 Tax=uncultured Nocardioides sp. TaxID=198441 RepID=A0A6J4NP97_9ACTN|nr:MAG: hypothetical protein AVDCRST_MAG60-1353 [uncultured Nocardioides sp.]